MHHHTMAGAAAHNDDMQQLGRIAEPLGGVFAMAKLKSYVLCLMAAVMALQTFCMYRLGVGGTAHVYEVLPDGQARYIGDREASGMPREQEAIFVAKAFTSRLFAWNSSTVLGDVAAAVSMCAPAAAEQLRRDFSEAQLVEEIRSRHVRSEIQFEEVRLIEMTRTYARVAVGASVQRFGLVQYEGAPIETQKFATEVTMGVVPRQPETRPNGLEVLRLVELAPDSVK